MKANASKHKAMSYGRMIEKEKELAQEVESFCAQQKGSMPKKMHDTAKG